MTDKIDKLIARRKDNVGSSQPNWLRCVVPDCDGTHIPNVPMLRKIWEHINMHPEEWDQTSWGKKIVEKVLPRDQRGRFTTGSQTVCRTSFCVAGHAVNMAGISILGENVSDVVQLHWTNERSVDGDRIEIRQYAAHILGLTGEEANYMFSAKNTLRDVRRYMERACKAVGDTL